MIKKIFEQYLAQDWHRGKGHVVKLAMTILPYRSVRSHYGPVLCCNPQDCTNYYAISSADYGHTVSDHISNLPVEDVFIDIGANYGVFTFLAAARMARVYAFEPNPAIYPYFLEAMLLNDCANVVPFHCAVGTENTLLTLKFDSRHSGQSSLTKDGPGFTVPVFNIAQWEVLNELKDSPAIHVKIDVEGYEAGIVETLKQASWYRNIKTVVVEIDDENLRAFGSSAKALYEMLEADTFLPAFGLDESEHYDEVFSRQTP